VGVVVVVVVVVGVVFVVVVVGVVVVVVVVLVVVGIDMNSGAPRGVWGCKTDGDVCTIVMVLMVVLKPFYCTVWFVPTVSVIIVWIHVSTVILCVFEQL
jgi:hypothetical protein